MSGRRFIFLSAVVVLPVLFALGCVKRKETLIVKPDGAVTVTIEYEGDKGDFDKGDAMPSEQGGWKVSRDLRTDENKKEEVHLTGERTFKPGEELPGSYAAPNDPDAGLYLKFPTTLSRERRKDGVYLHFRRVYAPRDWAYMQFWADAHIDDNIKKLGEKKPEELTHEERVQIIKAFAGVEAYKQIELAQRALKDTNPAMKPDHWLLARAALLKVYEEKVDWDALAKRHENTPQEDQDEQFERESQRILAEAHQAFLGSLHRDAEFDAEHLARFDAGYERAKKYYDITNQLGGQSFEIHVTMPGEIVAHNADTEDDGTVGWGFDGKAFRDRPYELMVTSRLPLDRDEK
ncbi:MAG: hypothetical protein V1790_18600 [Planctomycetota bacterium]